MSALALGLVLVAALLHALWNLAAKKAGGGNSFVLLCALLTVLLWAPLAIPIGWGQVGHWGRLEWGCVLASGLTHLVYFRTLLRGYRDSDLTVVYPVARGCAPLLAALAAVLVLGEHIAPVGVAGLLAVAAGLFLIAGGPSLFAKARDPTQQTRVRAGLGWGAATGVLIATYTVIDGYSVKVLALSPILVDYFGNLLRLPFMLPAAYAERDRFVAAFRAQWKAALVVAAFGPLGYVLVLYAMTLAPLSHVASAREISVLFAALLGGQLLREGDRALRLAGAACIAGGVAMLALG